jgi:predicted phage terminase large subunit-like protein
VDANFKKRKDADRAVVWVVGRKGLDRYLLDRFSGPVGFKKTVDWIRTLRQRWPRARRVYVEAKANGDAIIETLETEFHGVIEVPSEISNSGKEGRAEVMEPVVQSGHWFLPEHMAWTSEVVEEFSAFPNAAHDDDVDAGSQLECIWTNSDLEFARRMGNVKGLSHVQG